MKNHTFYIYIITNADKSVLYIGVTSNLSQRIQQHYNNKGNSTTFAGRYYCYNLIYWEQFADVNMAISREKEIKKWRREKKNNLIDSRNPGWLFLNKSI